MEENKIKSFLSQLKSKINDHEYNNHIDIRKEYIANTSSLIIVINKDCDRYSQLEEKIERTIRKNKHIRKVHKKQNLQNTDGCLSYVSDISNNFSSETKIFIRDFK